MVGGIDTSLFVKTATLLFVKSVNLFNISMLLITCYYFAHSGLDSVTSKYCITLLKQLAKAGQTIVCSIHQPSASLLNMIDHLYVMADGSCVYSGSTQNLVPYLSSLGLQCPTHYNPADYRK